MTNEKDAAINSLRATLADLYMVRGNFAERMDQEQGLSNELRADIQSHLDALESIVSRLESVATTLRRSE